MRGDYMTVCKFYFKNRVGQYFSNNALAFDYVTFSQNNSSFSVAAAAVYGDDSLADTAVCQPRFRQTPFFIRKFIKDF